jgi:hypothetical protein
MAVAAAPYLHQKLTPKESVAVHVESNPNGEDSIKRVIVGPGGRQAERAIHARLLFADVPITLSQSA